MFNRKEEKKKNFFQLGILHAIHVPGFALFCTMVGFSVLAKDAGLNLGIVLTTTLAVWGMPGQVAFASLYATGASLALIFFAVALANMRMMLMVISGYNILRFDLHHLPFWKKVFLMHIMAVTSWAQLSSMKDKCPPIFILSYYIGFSITIYIFGFLGTLVGFFIDHLVDDGILLVITFMTPLYILLLIISSRDNLNRSSVLLGGTLVPVLYPFFLEWSILIGGFIAGSITFGISSLVKR